VTLPTVVAGALRPSLLLTWTRGSGAPEDLTSATLSGCIRNKYSGVTQNIAGALVITNPTAGQFRWDFDALDVAAAGCYSVQFTAVFSTGRTPAKTFLLDWLVQASLDCL
jgi:hypothetical protein